MAYSPNKAPDDLVVVTEKVDGCNVGVLRRGDAYTLLSERGMT